MYRIAPFNMLIGQLEISLCPNLPSANFLNLPICQFAFCIFKLFPKIILADTFLAGKYDMHFCSSAKIFCFAKSSWICTKNYVEVPLKITYRQLDNSTLISAIHQASP